MKCSQALEAMLDAELADLSPDGTSALAMHLRSCAKCARVAATMRADVHALAAVMPGEPKPSRAPGVRWRGVAVACAAAVTLFVVTRERPPSAVRTQPTETTPVVVTPPPEVVRDEPSTPRVVANESPRRVASVSYAMPDPMPLEEPAGMDVPAVPVTTSTSTPAPTFDGVSASSSGSVIVLKTSNPKITVIWFN